MNRLTLRFTADMMTAAQHTAAAQPGVAPAPGLTITAERDGNSSEARVIRNTAASNSFVAGEDLEAFIVTRMPGRTQNRFFIVSGGSDGGQVPSPASLLISTRGATVRVLSTTGDVITSVQVCDTGGRLVCTASPCTTSYSFQLPAAGIYVVKAGTERVQQVKKITY